MMCKKCFLIVPVIILLCACGGKKDSQMWENAPVVATKTQLNGEDFITLDISLLKDTIVFPLSHFMEEPEFVKLDDSEDALVYPSSVELSDNYILTKTGRPSSSSGSLAEYRAAIPVPCKLFDKQGKFLTEIGAIGQGPGEYNNIYAMQLDEKNQRIYLMPWQSDKILVYDLQGNALDPIRMPYRTPKAVFKVKGDKVAVAIVAFNNINPSVAWVQNMEGEVLHEVPAGHLAVVPDFSNEVMSLQNTDAMDVSFWYWPARIDSLYNFNMQTGKLTPCFTTDFKQETPEVHSYAEWPNYFIGNTSTIVTISDGSSIRQEGKKPAYYIVDKKTFKGAFLRIENDYLGGEVVGNPLYLFDKGYYKGNMEPGQLLEWIEKILKSDKLTEKMREKLTTLQSTIDEDDNNYIIYAKMKR